jgi:hypothetical protein
VRKNQGEEVQSLRDSRFKEFKVQGSRFIIQKFLVSMADAVSNCFWVSSSKFKNSTFKAEGYWATG